MAETKQKTVVKSKIKQIDWIELSKQTGVIVFHAFLAGLASAAASDIYNSRKNKSISSNKDESNIIAFDRKAANG